MRKRPVHVMTEWKTILEGVEEMIPGVESLRKELLAGKRAKREGKPKRVAYHMRRITNILFNLEVYYWSPMFEWAQTETFMKEHRARVRRRQRNARSRKAR